MHGVRRITTFGLTLALCTSVLGCASSAAHLLATPLWQANDGAFGASMYWKPDGSEYGSYTERPLWSGASPPADAVRLGRPYLMFKADPDDPFGPYRFSVRIRAPGTSRAVNLIRTLVVQAQEPVADDGL